MKTLLATQAALEVKMIGLKGSLRSIGIAPFIATQRESVDNWVDLDEDHQQDFYDNAHDLYVKEIKRLDRDIECVQAAFDETDRKIMIMHGMSLIEPVEAEKSTLDEIDERIEALKVGQCDDVVHLLCRLVGQAVGVYRSELTENRVKEIMLRDNNVLHDYNFHYLSPEIVSLIIAIQGDIINSLGK